MLIVTTLSYDQLGRFIKEKQLSLNNEALLFGCNYDSIKNYMVSRLGSEGYVIGIKGRINKSSVELLTKLDPCLVDNRVVLEVNIPEDELLVFNLSTFIEAQEMLTFGLPDEVIYDHFDGALGGTPNESVQVICAPYIRNIKGVRITSLSRGVVVPDVNITSVKLKEYMQK